MSKTLVIALDSTRARVFRYIASKRSLEEITTLVHPENRLYDKDLSSDRQGYTFSSHGHGKKAFARSEDPKEHGFKLFVKEVSVYLKSSKSNNEFDQLIIIAGPKLLGALKKTLDNNIKKLITYELEKNIVKLSEAEIRECLPKYLNHPHL